MDGAEVAVDHLVRKGVRVCFGNPGTTEMNLVRALARHDGVRYVPTLFEGVAVSAADGWFRVSGTPAMCLLHNGIGVTNALSGLFNARRAGSASLVLVGDHSDALQPHLGTMSSGVRIAETALSAVSWAERIPSGELIGQTLDDAFDASGRAPGGPAVVAVPYDLAWSESEGTDGTIDPSRPHADRVSDERVADVAALLSRTGNVALLLGNDATRTEESLTAAGRIAAASGCRLLSRPSVLQRGAGRVAVEQFVYSPLRSAEVLRDIDHLILVGIDPPVTPWGYPGGESILMTRTDTEIHLLATPSGDVPDALQRLADVLGQDAAEVQQLDLPPLATGPATPEAVAQSFAALLPEDAIFLNEGISNGPIFHDSTAVSRRHTMLINVGGAIGWAQSAAIGAALAAPDRKVVAVQGDGAAMYTPQALWTIARENLDVLIVILANRTYKVLEFDLEFRGITDAHDLMRMDRPSIDWVSVSRGLGIEADSADDMAEFNDRFSAAVRSTGPRLLVVNLPD